MKILRFVAYHALLAVTLALGSQAAAQETAQGLPHQHVRPDVSDMIKRLQSGGHVLVIRHERTNAWLPDDTDFAIEDCASQRNLSVAGTANAVENGGVIRFLDIPIGNVFASPMCRTLDTARLMFRAAEPSEALYGYKQDPDVTRAAFETLVIDGVGQETNTALITHLGTYSMMFGGHIAEGDAAVVAVENDTPSLLGIIPANAWNDAVIDKTIRDRMQSNTAHDHN